jgi:pimeloyl-ACP methyl ester carboxylesterase
MTGSEDGEPVLFLHGNLSSSTFWEETMLGLPDGFRAVAPDQRGFGLSDPSQLVDATRGFADWADDVAALADHFGWDRFHLVGHSLGGCVAWFLVGSRPERLRTVTLIAPGPPCGFPGAHGDRGELNHRDGAGAGAGLMHPEFVKQLKAGQEDVTNELFSPRVVMNRVYWKPPFRPTREEELLKAMLQVHVGDRQFPGDWTASTHWPGFAPGRFGPINAISPLYNQGLLERILETQQKPPMLWIYGTADAVISDHSMSDPGQQGKLQLRPDWPGESVFPAQPLLTQVKFALDQYEQQGGSVNRLVLSEVGHTPYLERPLEVQAALNQHLKRKP